jgi:hypothetical protein
MNKADTERQPAVRENVTISYRGASYEIGRGPHFYGIWVVGAPQPQPVEWWPETPEGWSSAWARFTGIEAPGTIAAVRPAATGTTRTWAPPGPGPGPAPVPGTQPAMTPVMAPTPVGHPAALAAQPGPYPTQPAEYPAQPGAYPASYPAQRAAGARARVAAMAAAGLLVIGVVLGIVSLFPHYLFGSSLASEPANLWPHVIYLAAWAGSALLVVLGGARLRMGALLAAGTSIVTFGLFVSDAGYGSSAWGAGLVLGLIGWLACAAGSAVAVRLRQAEAPGRPQAFAARHVLAVVAALAALGTAITFAPSWDGYTLRVPGAGTLYRTLGNAFDNPGWVITGSVLVMIAVVLTVVVAALWRPVREGAWLLAGAIIPMAAQAISALIQVGEPTSPTQFGITPGEASRIGLTITNSLTPAFWLFCAFVLALMVGCGWLLLSPRATALDTAAPRGPHGPADGQPAAWPYAWQHPFSGSAAATAQPGQQDPETTQPHARETTGLDILDQETTDPDILDSEQGKVEPDTPEPGTQA